MEEEQKVDLTEQAYERLKTELEQLEDEIYVAMDDAATESSPGPPEGAEAHAAKDQRSLHEARIAQIREVLENAEIVDAEDRDVVEPGKLVTIRYEDDGESETYLVGVQEERSGTHEVMTLASPLGKAVMGHAQGEAVQANAPAGEIAVEIVDVGTR